MKYETKQVQFNLPSGVANCFLFSPDEKTEKLAVVLPGAGYSFRQPLLHFAIQALLQQGFIVLANDRVYGDDPAWRNLNSEAEARKVVCVDAVEFFKQVAAQFKYKLDTVVARSLGTYALACAIEAGTARPSQIVWQTPSLREKWPIIRNCGIRGLGILGTADHYFNEAIENLPDDRIIIENADHGMEIEGDPIKSIEVLREVTLATTKWIAAAVVSE